MGREQDSGETERMCERRARGREEEVASVVKWTVGEIHLVRSMYH